MRRNPAIARRSATFRRAFTLVEVMVAIVIIVIIVVPSVLTIQMNRVQSRAVGLNLIGENLAVSMMELIKRSGYNEIDYGEPMPAILDTEVVPSALLDFPRANAPGTDADELNLPAGPPGGVSATQMELFLEAYRSGTVNPDSPVITDDTNYLFLSPDQIAEMNGFENMDAVPEEERESLLDPGFAWGFYATDGDPAGAIGGGAPLTGVKHVAVVVKWNDPRRNRRDFTVLETYVSEVAPRM